jgi:AraC-like DNA-binding protein
VAKSKEIMNLSMEDISEKSGVSQSSAKRFLSDMFGYNIERLLVRNKMTWTFLKQTDSIPH